MAAAHVISESHFPTRLPCDKEANLTEVWSKR
jgi:hypothetical protein